MKTIKLFLVSIMLSLFIVQPVLAQAPEGTVLASWDSQTYGVGLGFDGQFIYIPDGINATQMKIYDTAGIFQGVLDLTCDIGNLSYDSTRNVFWAGQAITGSSAPIYTIDPTTGVCIFQFDALPAMVANGNCGNGCTWPFDGIDFDERDDTLRISLDGSQFIYSLNLDGTFNSAFGPIDTSVPCGDLGLDSFSSGIATGESEILYSATNGCTEVYKWDKDTGVKLDHFTLTAVRNEAMECDNITFAHGLNDAIWVKDLDGPVQAFAVPVDTCEILVPTIEKFYTYTNNNWADRCVETDPDTGLCIAYRLPNVNIDDDIFADQLPMDDGTYLLYGKERGKKTVVNPGQYMAVSVVDVPDLRDVWVVEDFSDCTDLGTVNPNKVPGGVQVVLIDANGNVHDIDDDLAAGIGGSINLLAGSAFVHVEGVPAGSQLRVIVKFQPSDELDIIGSACTNVEQLVDEAGEVVTEAAAGLAIVPAL